MKRLRVAVIASGFAGAQHVEAVRRLPNTEIVAMADANGEVLKRKGGALGIEQLYDDYRQMIEECKPDVVHNCTPNAMHYDINKYVMGKGIHIFCEKPLAIDAAQASELVDIAKRNKIANGVNFNYRHNAMVQEMRERLSAGDAGRVFMVHGAYLQDWAMFDDDYSWRMDSSAGGPSRTVADIGSHWFDTVQTAMGKRITAINASLVTVHEKRKKFLVPAESFVKSEGEYTLQDVDTEDGGFIMVRFQDGTQGMLVVSAVSGGYKNGLALSIDCERYSMRWEQQSADRLVFGSRELGERTVYADPGMLTGAARGYATLPAGHSVAWTDAVRNGMGQYYGSILDGSYTNEKQCYATFADAAYIMKIVDACLVSDKQRQWVSVEQ